MATRKKWGDNLERLQRFNRAIEEGNYAASGTVEFEEMTDETLEEAMATLDTGLSDIEKTVVRSALMEPDKESLNVIAAEMLEVLEVFETPEDKQKFLSAWLYAFLTALSKMYEHIDEG